MAAPARVLLLAGNGFIGSAAARRIQALGARVTVHHAGSRPPPAGVSEIVASRAPPPITEFPKAALAAAEAADAVIHFYCMGAADGAAFRDGFDGLAERLVLISSCDVYRAYGRFTGFEPGPPDATPLDETAPVRAGRHPYRGAARSTDQLEYWYDKLDAEAALARARGSTTTVLRLPKVFGAGGNADLATVYGYASQPDWRWTHGHVENVAAAIALAALHPRAAGEVFNLGEAHTPTMGERLADLPRRPDAPALSGPNRDFRQDLHFSTRKLRARLGFADVLDERAAMRALAETAR